MSAISNRPSKRTADETSVEHGVAIVATGATPYCPTNMPTARMRGLLTSLELDHKLMADDRRRRQVNTAVFIQCVGSREPERPYCSRVCCTHSVDNALAAQ